MGDTKGAWKSAEGHKGHGGGTEEGTAGTEGALRGAEGVWRVQGPWRGMEGWLPLAKS